MINNQQKPIIYMRNNHPSGIDSWNLVERFLETNYVCRYQNGLYIYSDDTGLWSSVDRENIKIQVAQFIPIEYRYLWTPAIKNRVLEHIDIQVKDMVVDEDKYMHLVALNNRILDVRSRETYKYSPSFFFRSKCNFDYDPVAKAPVFLKFLATVTEGNIALKNMLLELMGLCLTNYADKQLIFLAYGAGGDGKSTYFWTIQSLIGEGYYVNMNPTELENKFSRIQLEGKKLLILGDLPNPVCKNLLNGVLRGISGGDNIQAEQKYGGVVEFPSRLKIVASSNFLPIPDGEMTRGDERRIFLIPFRHSIREEEMDEHLREKLLKEMPGILNLALKNLAKLEQADYEFSYDGKAEWRSVLEQKRPVQGFVKACVFSCTGHFIKYSDIEQAFKRWCEEHQIYDCEYSSYDMASEIFKIFPNAHRHKKGGYRGIANVTIVSEEKGS